MVSRIVKGREREVRDEDLLRLVPEEKAPIPENAEHHIWVMFRMDDKPHFLFENPEKAAEMSVITTARIGENTEVIEKEQTPEEYAKEQEEEFKEAVKKDYRLMGAIVTDHDEHVIVQYGKDGEVSINTVDEQEQVFVTNRSIASEEYMDIRTAVLKTAADHEIELEGMEEVISDRDELKRSDIETPEERPYYSSSNPDWELEEDEIDQERTLF